MSTINIDIKSVRTSNYKLPADLAKISGVKRGIGLLKWRVPEEVQNEKEIKKRIEELNKQLDVAERELQEIYDVVNFCLTQYSDTENRLSENADMFV